MAIPTTFNGYPVKDVTPKAFQVQGITIIRWVCRVAYARNGNVGNPTHYHEWGVFFQGRNMGTAPSARAAKEFAKEVIETEKS